MEFYNKALSSSFNMNNPIAKEILKIVNKKKVGSVDFWSLFFSF